METSKCIKMEKRDKCIKMENIRKIKMEKRDKYVKVDVLHDLELKEEIDTQCIDQLKREIRCLKKANRSSEFGTEIWKKNYREIESKLMKLNQVYEKELESYRLKNIGLLASVEEKRKECVGLEEKLNDFSSRKDAVVCESNGLQIECSELKEQAAELDKGNKLMCGKGKNWQEQLLCLSNVKDKCVELETKNWALMIVGNDLPDENSYVNEQHAPVCGKEKDKCEQIQRKNWALELEKDRLEKELNGLQTECSGLKERVAELEEGNRLLCEKEKNGQEEILLLSNVKDKCEQLERKNRELELEKDRLQQELNGVQKDMSDENSHLKEQLVLVCEREKVALSRITDLCEEIRNLNGEKQDLIRTYSEEKRRECIVLEEKLTDLSSRKDAMDSEMNGLKNRCSELEERVDELKEERRVLCENMKNGQDEILRLSNVEDEFVQLERKNRALELEIKRLNKKLIDNMRVWKDLSDENSHVKEQQAPVGEREKVISDRIADLCDKIQNLKKEKPDVIKTDSADLSCSEKDVSDTEEENSNTNRSEEILSETENGSAEIICKPKSKSISEGIQHEASVDLDSAAYPKGDKNNPIDLEDGSESDDDLPYRFQLISCKKELQLSSTPKRKRAADTRTSEIKTEDADKAKKLNAGKNVLLECFPMEMQTPNVSAQSRSIEENKGQDERASNGEPKWSSWLELYLSLVKDPELCLKAVCALCRQQASKEKPEQVSLGDSTGCGFLPMDEVRGTELGDFLMDGNRAGDLKKSVEELKLSDPRGLDECRTLAKDYSDQLFNIYQSKEDPYFSL